MICDILIPNIFLKKLKEGNLFYPCSGKDFIIPIESFLPWISSFWFVDVNYNSQPALKDLSGYRLLKQSSYNLAGKSLNSRYPYEIKIFRQEYQHNKSNQQFTISKCRGRGYDAFRSVIKLNKLPLSIFFYRGDSQGESGSGFYWLKKPRLGNILEVLEDGGLVVTDGSNCHTKYFESERFHGKDNISGKEAFDMAKSFSFANRQFQCIGYLDNKYGPTLIWQANIIIK